MHKDNGGSNPPEFVYRLAEGIMFYNDFALRARDLETWPWPLALVDPRGRWLWRNQDWRRSVTASEEGPLAERVVREGPPAGFVGFGWTPLPGSGGRPQAFLVHAGAERGVLGRALARAAGGVALARAARFIYANPAAEARFPGGLTGRSWQSVEGLPAWDRALALPPDGRTLVGWQEGALLRLVHVETEAVLLEVLPQAWAGEQVSMEQVAMVMHEIRNPLAALSGFLELALDRLDRLTRPEDVQSQVLPHLQHAAGEVERLSRLTGDLLWTTRGMVLNRSAHSLSGLAKDAWALAAGDNPAVRLEVAGDATLWVDPDRFSQVLLNLFRNAVEAMQGQGGTVRVAAEPAGSGVAVIIADDGPGIPPAIQDRLFSAFVSTKPHGNGGLGLLIARHLVEAHGGRLSLSSAPGQGTTVRIELPTP